MSWQERLKAAKAKLAQARKKFEADQAALLTDSGQRLFSDAEHTRRLAAITETWTAALTEAETVADEIAQVADAEMQQRLNHDPLDDLTPEQLQVAAARRAFVREDVESMSVVRLRDRIEALMAGKDPVLPLLYVRYAKQRPDVVQGPGNPDLNSLRRLLEEAGTGAQDVAPLREQLKGAREFRREVGDARSGMIRELYLDQARAAGTLPR